jgi:hypothetical protein
LLNTNRFVGIEANRSPEYVPQSEAGRYWWLAGIVVGGVAGLLFALTRFGFFQGDDFTLISQLVTNNSAGPLGYFTRDWGLEGRYYAPLPRFFFWVEFQLFHNTAYGWHLVSALLHTACAVLVWLLAWRLTRRPAVALCAGLFFAAFPVHVPVVGQISGQANLLAAVFCLASAVTFLYARQIFTAQPDLDQDETRLSDTTRLHNRYYYLSIGFYGVALLCKQEAIALPLALLAFDFITGGVDRLRSQQNRLEAESDREGTTASSLLAYYTPYLVLMAMYLVINMVFLGGLSAYLPGANPGSNLPEFLRSNLRELAQPFSLGGTDGLIVIAALIAFLCLTGVQEWEAWQLNNPGRLEALRAAQVTMAQQQKSAYEDEDELDDPQSLQPARSVPEEEQAINPPIESAEYLQPVPARFLDEEPVAAIEPEPNGHSPETVENPPPLVGEDTKTDLEAANQGELRPPYWGLRAAGYGVLWTAAFLLPFILQGMSKGPLYLASAGFAIFLAASLAPFGTSAVHRAADKRHARSLFGHFELSFWLRIAAISVLVCVYFASTVGKVTDWNQATKPVGLLLSLF